MPEQQMKVKVEFPTWGKLSRPQKSLISFFMENASLFINWEPYRDQKLISASIAFNYFNAKYGDDDYPCSSLYIPFTEREYLYEDIEDGDVLLLSDRLPNTFNTELVKIESLLVWVNPTFSYEDQDYTYPSVARFEDDFIPVPATLIPMIDDVENTDTALIPSFVANGQENEFGHKTLQVEIDKTGMDFSYDFQLRTSSFTIGVYSWIENEDRYDTDNPPSQTYDVYYKIGLCPFNDPSWGVTDEEVMSTVKLQLKQGVLKLEDLYYSVGDGSLAISIYNIYNDHLGYNETSKIFVDPNYYSDVYKILPNKFILNYGGQPIYFQLCNQDGTPVSSPIGLNQSSDQSNNGIKIYPKYASNTHADDGYQYGEVVLSITDQSVDGGFVTCPSQYNYNPGA